MLSAAPGNQTQKQLCPVWAREEFGTCAKVSSSAMERSQRPHASRESPLPILGGRNHLHPSLGRRSKRACPRLDSGGPFGALKAADSGRRKLRRGPFKILFLWRYPAVGSFSLPLAWASKTAGPSGSGESELDGWNGGAAVAYVLGDRRRTLAHTGRVEVYGCSCTGVSEVFNPWL